MKLVGYQRADFTTKDGIEVNGWNVYLSSPIDPENGKGVACERIYLTTRKAEVAGIELAMMVNKDVEIFYNRYGKVEKLLLRT